MANQVHLEFVGDRYALYLTGRRSYTVGSDLMGLPVPAEDGPFAGWGNVAKRDNQAQPWSVASFFTFITEEGVSLTPTEFFVPASFESLRDGTPHSKVLRLLRAPSPQFIEQYCEYLLEQIEEWAARQLDIARAIYRIGPPPLTFSPLPVLFLEEHLPRPIRRTPYPVHDEE